MVVTVRTQQLMQTSGKKMIGEGIVQTQTPDNTPTDPLEEGYEPNRGRQAQDWDDDEEE